jgi:hypothetical protein
VAFGDYGTGRTEASSIRNHLLRENFDLAVLVGDLSEQAGTYESYHSTYFQPLAELIARNPFIPVPGNGDYETEEAQAFRQLFVPPVNESRAGALYFSFDYGNVHFVGLDTERITDEQVSWLRADLAAKDQPWTIVYMHRPAFGEGSIHPINEEGAVEIRRRLVPIFEEFGVDVVMSAHNAMYGRTPPLTDGQVGPPYARVADKGERGVVYITAGGSADGPTAAYTDPFHQPPLGTSVATNNYTRTSVTECALTIEAIDIRGAIIDTAEIRRCP